MSISRAKGLNVIIVKQTTNTFNSRLVTFKLTLTSIFTAPHKTDIHTVVCVTMLHSLVGCYLCVGGNCWHKTEAEDIPPKYRNKRQRCSVMTQKFTTQISIALKSSNSQYCLSAQSHRCFIWILKVFHSFISFIHFIHSFHSFISFIHSFHSFIPFIHFIHSFHSFISFIHSFISFIHSISFHFIHSFFLSSILSFFLSFTRSFTVSFLHSVIYLFIQLFVHSIYSSLTKSFIHSFYPFFPPSFVRSFVCSLYFLPHLYSFLCFFPSFLHSFILCFVHSIIHSFAEWCCVSTWKVNKNTAKKKKVLRQNLQRQEYWAKEQD